MFDIFVYSCSVINPNQNIEHCVRTVRMHIQYFCKYCTYVQTLQTPRFVDYTRVSTVHTLRTVRVRVLYVPLRWRRGIGTS